MIMTKRQYKYFNGGRPIRTEKVNFTCTNNNKSAMCIVKIFSNNRGRVLIPKSILPDYRNVKITFKPPSENSFQKFKITQL